MLKYVVVHIELTQVLPNASKEILFTADRLRTAIDFRKPGLDFTDTAVIQKTHYKMYCKKLEARRLKRVANIAKFRDIIKRGPAAVAVFRHRSKFPETAKVSRHNSIYAY